MSDGLKFLTLGGCEEVIVGNDYAATIGMTSYTYIGSETSINVGLENTIKLGGEFAYAYGSKCEWTNVGGYSLEEGEVFKLGDTVAKQAGTSLTFSAGYGPTALVEATTLAALKTSLKAAVTTMTAVNVALGVAASAVLVGMSEGEETQEGWEPAVVSASAAAINAAVTTALYVALKKSMQALLHTYEHLAKVSTMSMDATGIKQLAGFTATGSSMILCADGASLNAGLAGVATVINPLTGEGATDPVSSLKLLATGEANLNGDLSATITGASVKVGQVPLGNVASGLSSKVGEVVLTADPASNVTLTPLNAKIVSPDISILAGENGLTANPIEVIMACGPSGVNASPAEILLSSGATMMRLTAAGLEANGPLIQLG